MPLHGADVIVEAAALLDHDPEIRFVLVGAGQTKAAVVERARALGCEHVSFVPPCQGDDLRALLCSADVWLGVFGDSEKTKVVVPNKVVDALALGKPLITADTPAIRRVLDSTQVRTVPARDARALADEIGALHADATARAALANAGRTAYEARFSPAALRSEVSEIVTAFSR
jgi:glycosyltransferase involved in cell wall biosynthesis